MLMSPQSNYTNERLAQQGLNDILVDFLIGHYTYRMFPPAIDIIPTSLAVVYSNGKYTNYKNKRVTTR